MIVHRLMGSSLSIRHDIIERTDGIPLFVEEITKAVLEAENEGVTERATARAETRASTGSGSAKLQL